jgi:hypothetical protein
MFNGRSANISCQTEVYAGAWQRSLKKSETPHALLEESAPATRMDSIKIVTWLSLEQPDKL